MATVLHREEDISIWLRKRLGSSRLLLCAALTSVLIAGCALNSGELTPRVPTSVSPNSALIFPPIGGPAILGIVETVHSNAVIQEISLATEARTPGQNKITVTLFEGRGGDGSGSGPVDVPFTQINLTEEALAAWPNSGMSVSPFYVQNDYGPFGYAVGRPSTGDTCLYAWQRIEPALKPSGAVARGAIVIRLQLCDSSRSEESLLAVMYQLRVNVPVFEPLRAPVQIGRIAAPIKPVGAAGFTPIVKPPSRPAPTRPRPVAEPVAAPAAVPLATPPVGAPIVPLPGGNSAAPGGPIVPTPTAATTSVIVPLPPTGSGQ